MRAVTGAIRWPETLDAYFDTHESTLNPRNNEQIYSYGTLPLFATRAVAEWLDRGCGAAAETLPRWIAQRILQHLNHPQPHVAGWSCYPGTFTWTYSAYIGRHLAALADMGTLIVIGLVAQQLYTRRISLLAMTLTATTAFMIQQAHFYTVDSAATFFTVLTAYFAVRAGLASTTGPPPWTSLALAGLSTGLAAACKVSAALAAGLVALGALAWVRRRLRGDVVSPAAPAPHVTPGTLSGKGIAPAARRFIAAGLRVAPAVLLAGLLSLLAFRVAQPYAFEGPGFFGIQPSPEWFGRLSQISEEQSGSIDYPSGRQWTNRLPVLFPWLNIVVWGMGLPLGCAAWIGWALMGIELAKGDRRHLILWVWTTAFFAFYATRWVKAMRYFLPIYPFLILMAAYALDRLVEKGRTAGRQRQEAREQERRPGEQRHRIVRWAAIGTMLAVMLGTLAWGTGFSSIYTRPHTRIAASSWIYANVPDGSVVANEHWDWGLPLRIEGQDGFRVTGVGPTFTGFTMEHYNEDTPEKRGQLISWLDQADYLFLASNRLYSSIPRLPERYPMTTEYYRALFGGELGFELAAEFTSYIRLGPLTFPDQETPFTLMTPGWAAQSAILPLALVPAEESFSVYDHPDCLVFRKTAEYSHERTATVLNAVNLDDAHPWQTPQEATPQAVHRAHTVAFYGLLTLTVVVAVVGLVRPETDKEQAMNRDDTQRVQPYPANRFYWQYRGRPVLLLGGSREDNLFQVPDLEAQLDLLASVGGNYLRCTMSSRDPGDVWPFERDPATGLYDLNRPGQAYWERFHRFLDLTAERDIIIQIELWDRFDFSRSPWQDNPYNPKNNINYTVEASSLRPDIDTHPGQRENAFFRTVPTLENNAVVLPYQLQQVAAMLSLSLNYGNVLYCMDNETNSSPKWGAYWSGVIKEQAATAGVSVYTTEMWDDHSLLGPAHANTLDHPELYGFADISQNNHQVNYEHWANPQEIRRRVLNSGHIRPLNSIKIYGANSGRYGTTRDAQERFWRNIFGGLASSRFHRPTSGLGLNDIAQTHIRSMRMLTAEIDIFSCEPATEHLSNRSRNEAYCTANPGADYGVFFPDGGDVILDVSSAEGKLLTVHWLDIRESQWTEAPKPIQVGADNVIHLVTPADEGYWAAVIKAGR